MVFFNIVGIGKFGKFIEYDDIMSIFIIFFV